MIQKITILLFCLVSTVYSVNAQNTASVEESIYGVQTGILGIWVHNETRLSNSIALRSEIGLNGGFAAGSFVEDNFQWVLAPTLNVEPRWYYNLEKREAKGKIISNNTANFFSIKTAYNPDWFIISSSKNNSVVENFTATANWGIKRTLWEHFTYEVGLGLGYGVEFWSKYGYAENDSFLAADLQLRIGYTF